MGGLSCEGGSIWCCESTVQTDPEPPRHNRLLLPQAKQAQQMSTFLACTRGVVKRHGWHVNTAGLLAQIFQFELRLRFPNWALCSGRARLQMKLPDLR
jgi:hypothetical protein